MHSGTSLATYESAGAAARILEAIRSGTIGEIEQELRIAAQVCGAPFPGDSAEAERRELLDSIVSRFRSALVSGETFKTNSRSLSACFALLEHLGETGTTYRPSSTQTLSIQ